MSFIFFDIDNTLISHKGISHIPPETREAVRRLKDAGHITAIATGRGGFLTFTTAQEFGIEYLVCSGGAQLFVKGKEIYRADFPREYLSSFMETAQKFPTLTAAIDEKYLYASAAFMPFFDYFNKQAGYDCIRPLREMQKAIICYMMVSPEKLTRDHGLFYAPPAGVRLELMHAFTEARCENSSKWSGIEKMINYLGGSLDDVVVFGDGPNDVEMIARASVGVAVGNASEDVKAAANYVSDDIDDGGILTACENLGLI